MLDLLHAARYGYRELLKALQLASRWDANELIYERLFRGLLERNGIAPIFDPIGVGANFSLLYVLGRIVEGCPVHSALDLGAGQTTLLLDQLSSAYSLEVLTLEDDEWWASEMRSRVRHPVLHAPLCALRVDGRRTVGYDLDALLGDQRFDLVIVDGPSGWHFRWRSRWGALALISRLRDDFVVIFDDAERIAEWQTAGRFVELLRRAERPAHLHEVRGRKSQLIIHSPAWRAAQYL